MASKYKIFDYTKSFGIHCFLLIVALSCLLPLFWMIRSSFMTNDTIFVDKSIIPALLQPENYLIAWREGNFGRYFLNSLLYTTGVVIGVLIVSSLAAYGFSRLQFPGKDAIFFMFVAAMMIPLPGSFVSLFYLMNKTHLVNTYHGYILCMINVNLSLSIYLLKTFFDKIPPDLEDAARIDGCNKFRIWWDVALPLARPAIGVIVITTAMSVWNEYILASLLLHNDMMPLQRGLIVFNGANQTDYPVLMAGLTITAAPIILVYILMQKHIVKGLSSGAVVG